MDSLLGKGKKKKLSADPDDLQKNLPEDYKPLQKIDFLKVRGKFELNPRIKLVHVDELSPFCNIYTLKKEDIKMSSSLPLHQSDIFARFDKLNELEIPLEGSQVEYTGIPDVFSSSVLFAKYSDTDVSKAKIIIRTPKTCYFLSGFASLEVRKEWFECLIRAKNWLSRASYVLNEWENSECKVCIGNDNLNSQFLNFFSS